MKLNKLLLLPLLAILVVALFIFLINPRELSKQARDERRVADLEKLQRALDFYLTKNAKVVADKSKILCPDCSSGQDVFSYRSIVVAGITTKERARQYVNSTGWVPVDFSANVKLGETPLLLLPVDPLEKGYRVRQNFPLISMFFSSPEDFVYTFTAGKEGKYKLTAKMESNVGLEKAKDDGGNLDERLEVGSDLKLKP